MAELSVNCPKCQAANNVALGADVETYTCSACGEENPLVDSGPVEAATDPLIGAVISECKIVEKLGEGGFGAVYKALDQNLQRPVALKVMLQSLTSNQEFVQKFIREAITAAQLNHPNIVSIHKVGRDEKRGIHYLIMELLEGRTLEDIVADKGVLKVEEAVPFILQSAEALAAAHDKKIVHRDIKPENIMVDRRGVVKIMDFGLAKVVQPDMKSTKVMGTPHYMSPEQFEGKQVDGRTDIYSLGVTFYYLLSKQRPYEGTNTVQIIYAILTSEPKPLPEAAPTVPPEIWAVIQKMIAKKADDRYADFREVRKELLAYQEKSLADRIHCPQCGAKNQRGKKFCRQCGGNLQVQCPACGADEVAGVQVCNSCGAAIETLLAVRQNLERAQRLKSVGDLRRAYLLLKEVVKLDPEHEEAKKEISEIDVALQEVESVKSEALELEKTGNLEEALGKVEELLGRYPGSDDIKRQRDVIKRAYDGRIIAQHMKRADESIAAGNLQAGLVALDAALRLDPKREDILASRKDLDEKIRAAEAARAEARKAFEAKRYAEAFRRATEVLKSHPTDAEAAQLMEKCRGFLDSSEEFVRRGRDHLQAGRLGEARKELEAAFSLRPDDAEVKGLLEEVETRLQGFREALAEARTALGTRDFEKARGKVAEVLKNIPGDPEALGLMATIARQEQEARRAEEVEGALAEGEELERTGDLEGALAAFRRACDADPDSSKASQARDKIESRIREVSSVRSLAEEHLRDGRFEDALGSLEKLVKLLPDDEKVRTDAEAARRKVEQIRDNLRKAERAAAEKRHPDAIQAAAKVLELSPHHVRAQSLKRDAERAMGGIERHLKEADRLISSEIFEEALDHLKKARQKGAGEDMVKDLERTAVSGITAALKTEATRFYAAKDYGASLDAYERILELKPDDDARKGKKEAEKRLRALTSEPLTLRSVVAGGAVAVLVMMQIAAVQFRTRPPLGPESSTQGITPAQVELNAAVWRLEEAGRYDAALKAWAEQPAKFAEMRERAETVIAAFLKAGDASLPPLDRIRELQKVKDVLGQDEEVAGSRAQAATALLASITEEAIRKLDAVPAEQAQQLIVEYTRPDLTEGQGILAATELNRRASDRRGITDAKFIIEFGFTNAKATRTHQAWKDLGNDLRSKMADLSEDTRKELEEKEKYLEKYRTEWKKDLAARLQEAAKGGDGEAFLASVVEASDYAEEFGLLEKQDELIRDLKAGVR